MIPFPDKKYSVIYADPPWSYSGGGAKRNVTRHYHTMKAEETIHRPSAGPGGPDRVCMDRKGNRDTAGRE